MATSEGLRLPACSGDRVTPRAVSPRPGYARTPPGQIDLAEALVIKHVPHGNPNLLSLANVFGHRRLRTTDPSRRAASACDRNGLVQRSLQSTPTGEALLPSAQLAAAAGRCRGEMCEAPGTQSVLRATPRCGSARPHVLIRSSANDRSREHRALSIGSGGSHNEPTAAMSLQRRRQQLTMESAPSSENELRVPDSADGLDSTDSIGKRSSVPPQMSLHIERDRENEIDRGSRSLRTQVPHSSTLETIQISDSTCISPLPSWRCTRRSSMTVAPVIPRGFGAPTPVAAPSVIQVEKLRQFLVDKYLSLDAAFVSIDSNISGSISRFEWDMAVRGLLSGRSGPMGSTETFKAIKPPGQEDISLEAWRRFFGYQADDEGRNSTKCLYPKEAEATLSAKLPVSELSNAASEDPPSERNNIRRSRTGSWRGDGKNITRASSKTRQEGEPSAERPASELSPAQTIRDQAYMDLRHLKADMGLEFRGLGREDRVIVELAAKDFSLWFGHFGNVSLVFKEGPESVRILRKIKSSKCEERLRFHAVPKAMSVFVCKIADEMGFQTSRSVTVLISEREDSRHDFVVWREGSGTRFR